MILIESNRITQLELPRRLSNARFTSACPTCLSEGFGKAFRKAALPLNGNGRFFRRIRLDSSLHGGQEKRLPPTTSYERRERTATVTLQLFGNHFRRENYLIFIILAVWSAFAKKNSKPNCKPFREFHERYSRIGENWRRTRRPRITTCKPHSLWITACNWSVNGVNSWANHSVCQFQQSGVRFQRWAISSVFLGGEGERERGISPGESPDSKASPIGWP